MDYPEKLKQLANKRMNGFQVEGFVTGQGSEKAKLLLIGEAPGKTEIDTQIPFSSRPYHIKIRSTKMTYPNRTPNKQEIFAHAPLLDYEINVIQPQILAPMGNIGLQRLLGSRYTVSKVHGQLLRLPIFEVAANGETYQLSQETYSIYPLFHPASIMYNPALEPSIEADWRHLKEIMATI